MESWRDETAYDYSYAMPNETESEPIIYSPRTRPTSRQQTRIERKKKSEEIRAVEMKKANAALFSVTIIAVVICAAAVLAFVLRAATISECYTNLNEIKLEIEEKRASIDELNAEVGTRIASENYLEKVSQYEQKAVVPNVPVANEPQQ